MKKHKIFGAVMGILMLGCFVTNAGADGITIFSTGSPTNLMATASRPASTGKIEIESADDFVLGSPTNITGATFTGLLSGQNVSISNIGQVTVEIYRLFPADSDVGRTSGPPTFSTSQVPTRVNSPSDVQLTDRDSAARFLSFSTRTLSANFTASNSILNGINPKPSQATGGEGAVIGMEVEFDVTFATPFSLPADHYFFVPQVQVNGGEFYWLSAPRPIVPPGTPFPPGYTDLQSWIRNANLDPDWLRVGTDIVGGTTPPTFNASFSLIGSPVPEPATMVLLGAGLIGLAAYCRKKSI